MVICNILVSKPNQDTPLGYDEKIRRYQGKFYINVIENINGIENGVPTLVYTYELAKSLFPNRNLNPTSDWKINEYYFWSDKLDDIDLFIEESTRKWFNYVDVGVDVVLEEFDSDWFSSTLESWPLIHNGKFELYFSNINKDGTVIIRSIQKSALKFIGKNPEDLFYSILDKLNGKYLLLSTDDVDLRKLNTLPLFVEDIIQSMSGELIKVKDIVNIFKPRELTKGEALVFYHRKITPFREKLDLIWNYIHPLSQSDRI